MKLPPICEMQLHYTWIDYVAYGVGGQYVGTLEGTATGDRLRGTVKSVNVSTRRPDNVNCPAFRGLISPMMGRRSISNSTASRSCGPKTKRARLHYLAIAANG